MISPVLVCGFVEMDRVLLYMADHAGGRTSVVNLGTKLWRPPVEVTQFWRPRSGFGARFFARPKKVILIKRRGNSMKQKLLEMIQVNVWLQTDEFIFVWFYKNKNGRQNRYSGAKTELLQRRASQCPG